SSSPVAVARRRGGLGSAEPECEFALRAESAVAAVHQVLLHVETPVPAEIAADRSGSGRGRVGGARKGTEALDHPLTLCADGDGRPRPHELDEGLEEGLALMLFVV